MSDIRQTVSAGMARAQRVEKTGRHFIVIAEDEPYFAEAYGLVRLEETRRGTWTDEDEAAFRRLTEGAKRPYQGQDEHPENYSGPCFCNLCLSYGEG